jgi:hypothetical protein
VRAAPRRAARVILSALLVISLAFAGWNALQLWRSPVAGILVERGEAELSARLERLLAREVTPAALDRRLTERLAAEPRDWAAIDALMDLAEARGVRPSEPVLAAVAAADAEDRSAADRARDCLACAWDPANCDLSAIALCQVAVAVLPFGDAVSVARESGHYASGAEVDVVDLGLSTLGLAATFAVPLTAGASTLVKAGAGVTRTAYRIGALSGPLVEMMRAAMRSGIDWARLSGLRPGAGMAEEMAGVIRPRYVRPAVDFLEEAGGLVKTAGTRDAIFLLGKADDARDVRMLARIAKPLRSRAAGTVEFIGKSRLRRIATRYADEVYGIAFGIYSAFLSLCALAFSVVKSATLRLLRRLAR